MRTVTAEVERLRRLGAWEEIFTSPDFSVGEPAGGRANAEGVIQMPYMDYSPAIWRFRTEMGQLGWVYPFDWPAWAATPRGQQLVTEPAEISTSTADELAKVLTTIIRSDRFSDFAIAHAFEGGFLTAIARRARQLASEL
jgi:hypothetical protein